jgi:hypothetical protein
MTFAFRRDALPPFHMGIGIFCRFRWQLTKMDQSPARTQSTHNGDNCAP